MNPEEAYEKYVPAANPIELIAVGEPAVAMQIATIDQEAASTEAAMQVIQVARRLVSEQVWRRLPGEVRAQQKSREDLMRWLISDHVQLNDTYDSLAQKFAARERGSG